MKSVIVGMLGLLVLAGCDGKSVDGTKERASAESEASRDVENTNQGKKAEKMEADLTARHRYYGAIEGKFEGEVSVQGEPYKMRVTLLRSIPPYTGERVRQLSEIESDLNGLYYNVHIVQWDPADTNTAVGCRVSQVRPNFKRGIISINSSECPSAYTFYLSKEGKAEGTSEGQASEISEKVSDGQLKSVGRLVGTVQPSWNANTYTLDIKRSN